MNPSNATRAIVAAASVLAAASGARAASIGYAGNGASGFGGPVGLGTLTVSDTLVAGVPSVTFSLATGNGANNLSGNGFVLYIDSTTGGAADTSTFTDNGDGGRESISGYNATNTPSPTRSLATFATGFGADYALSFENSFVGLFKLDNPANFTFQTGTGQGGTAPFAITLPDSALGISPGGTIKFVGSLISTTAYRSNEAIGPSDQTAASPNPGFTGSITFSGSDSFTTASIAAVPEPATLGLLALGGLGLLRSRRRA